MKIMKKSKNKINTIIIVTIVMIAVMSFAYIYGHKLPLLKNIPFFAKHHEHKYKPVLDEEGNIDYWTCSMHPSVKLKEPGQCPICGMDTVPVYKKQDSNIDIKVQNELGDQSPESSEDMSNMSGMSGHDHSAMSMPPATQKGGDTKSVFNIDTRKQQMIGVKTETVQLRTIQKKLRTVGMVELDETKIEHVHAKISGWVEKVYVDYTWQHVNKGDPLFSIYSPELVSTQEEYLLALRSKEILGDSKFDDISSGANSLLEATRKRLELWDISKQQIKEIEQTGKAKKELLIYSPVSGHVMKKNVFSNMHVEPNMTLYSIADHSTVWVDADIYENEIALIKLTQEAKMTTASLPGVVFTGKVSFIWPHLDPKSRTVKARIVFPNPDLKLLPEMYVNVTFDIPLGKTLAIPKNAVLRTGKQDIVFVDQGNGNMEIKRVILGHSGDGYYEVAKGLKEGEKIVIGANFLIDSESKVQAAVASWDDDASKEPLQIDPEAK